MASMVTTAPARSSRRSNSGMAVISFDLPSTACWPRSRWFSLAQALIRCSAPFPPAPSKERRKVLPSMATRRPSVASTRTPTQLRKPRRKAAGSRRAKTRLKVSWAGMPLARPRKVRSQGRFVTPVLLDINPGIGAGDDGADGEGDDVPEAVQAAVLAAEVLEVGEAVAQANRGGLGHESPP